MVKAVIFDLDGVLVSTDVLHFEAWKKLACEIGITDYTEKDNVRQRGVSRMASLEVLLEKSSVQYSEEEKLELAQRKNDVYVKSLEVLSEKDVLPGAIELLEYLRENGIKTAVGSASKNAPLILEKTGLIKYLDAVSCGLDTTKSKPDPEVFLVAAKKLGIDASDCLVAEDSDAGIEAAKNGGMLALAVGEAKQNPLADFSALSLAHFNAKECSALKN